MEGQARQNERQAGRQAGTKAEDRRRAKNDHVVEREEKTIITSSKTKGSSRIHKRALVKHPQQNAFPWPARSIQRASFAEPINLVAALFGLLWLCFPNVRTRFSTRLLRNVPSRSLDTLGTAQRNRLLPREAKSSATGKKENRRGRKGRRDGGTKGGAEGDEGDRDVYSWFRGKHSEFSGHTRVLWCKKPTWTLYSKKMVEQLHTVPRETLWNISIQRGVPTTRTRYLRRLMIAPRSNLLPRKAESSVGSKQQGERNKGNEDRQAGRQAGSQAVRQAVKLGHRDRSGQEQYTMV